MTRPRVVASLLVLITVAVYLPVWQCAFLTFDDPDYVTDNRMVRAGLTSAGMKSAFTTTHAFNWHPLTWVSHMTDCQLFGLRPGAHHLANVLFHAVNAALLFLLLLRVTAAMWPAAFVAAMFALHPLHVESVAWVSERKDVLSTFFGLLAMAAYARHVAGDKCRGTRTKSVRAPIVTHVTHRPSRPYVLSLLFFALGLMAKPMLVTLPFVLVLLDWWPLQRVSGIRYQTSGSGAQYGTRNSEHVRLLFEKWPFLVLTVLSCLVTFLAQRGAVISVEQLPLGLRLANAFRSYALYLFKAIWPADLSIIYPFPSHTPAWQLAGAGVLLGAISWFAWRLRRRCPYLLVGWLWYLGMLVPVIGLVQVGGQAMADRYTYLPLVGILIAVAFGAHDLAKRFPNGNKLAGIAATVSLMACLFVTERQLRHWHDSVALFSHAVGVTENNALAHMSLGFALYQEKRLDDAIVELKWALKLRPTPVDAHNILGAVLLGKGRVDEALAQFDIALKLRPDDPSAHNNRAAALFRKGDTAAAIVEYETALRLKPDYVEVENNLGAVLLGKGRVDEALAQFNIALKLDPDDPVAHNGRAAALLRKSDTAAAIVEYETALRLKPDYVEAENNLAWLLATSPEPSLRNGPRALHLARDAARLSDYNETYILDTLAAAFAETGQFAEAIKVAEQATQLATAQTNTALADSVRLRLEGYRAGKPFHEGVSAGR
jgi:protein O-mannosyl-transferase